MRSPLRCLVTPWGSAPRILISSLFILKGDFAATFRLSCELITMNLIYGDQPNKGEDPIRGGQSSAFLFHAEGGAPAPPRHDFLQLLGVGEGPFMLIESIEFRFWFSSGAPHPPGSPTRGHRRGSPAQKVPGLPPSYTPNRSLAASIGIDPRPARQTSLTSRLNSAGRIILPSWLKKRVEKVCRWVTARRLVHLNPQNPPLQPHRSHLTANKAPTSEERSR